MWDTQPQTVVRNMNSKLESLLLSEADVGNLSLVIEEYADYRRIQFLVAMKQISTSLDNLAAQGQNFLIDRSGVKHPGEVTGRELGYIDDPENGKVYTPTEILEYQDAWIDRSDALITRVNGLVSLLNRTDISETLPLLQCRDFCHISERQAFGLIYQIPNHFVRGPNQPQPITLAQMIQKTQPHSKRPLLDEIFLLAQLIATSVQTFHKAGWLHKAISDFTFIFFPSDPEAPGNSIKSPHFVGFNHSRESNNNAFTVGPTSDIELEDYQDPE